MMQDAGFECSVFGVQCSGNIGIEMQDANLKSPVSSHESQHPCHTPTSATPTRALYSYNENGRLASFVAYSGAQTVNTRCYSYDNREHARNRTSRLADDGMMCVMQVEDGVLP